MPATESGSPARSDNRRIRQIWLPLLASMGVLACGEDPSAPTGPEVRPALATSSGQALAFRQISAGTFYSCGATSGSRAYCWGINADGQLGDGTHNNDSVPVPVASGLQFVQVSASATFTCGVTATKRAYCWGTNSFGQLGNGSTSPSLTPVAVVGGLLFRQVSAGSLHACGLTTTDEAWCWGNDKYGQLGDSSTLQRSLRPVKVAGGRHFLSLMAGGFSDQGLVCGVTYTNRGYCWGYGFSGAIGDGKTANRRFPRLVTGNHRFTEIAAGVAHVCAVATDSAAWCWGENFFAELGDGSTTMRSTPVAVLGGKLFRRIAAGENHSCGVATTGAGYCWGQGYYGALGDGAPLGGGDHSSPVAVVGGLAFSDITAGHDDSCGVTTAGQGYCWGNGGGLGSGSSAPSSTPVAIAAPN